MRAKWLILLFLLVLPFGAHAADGVGLVQEVELQEDVLEQKLEELLDTIDLSPLQQLYDTLAADALGSLSLQEFVRAVATGSISLDSGAILSGIGNLILGNLRGTFGLLVQLLIPALLYSLLAQTSIFSKEGVADICCFACYVIMCGLLIANLRSHMAVVGSTIAQMTKATEFLFPILLALLLSMGGIAGSGLLQPATAGAIGVLGSVTGDIVLPLVMVLAALAVASNLTERAPMQKMLGLVKTLIKWLLGLTSTVLVAVLSIQGLSAALFDGVSIRTARYAVDQLVPVVGKVFSDTVDLLISCTMLAKNAVGIAGALVIVLACAVPVVQIFATLLGYKMAAALMQPIADKRLVQCLEDFSGVLQLMMVSLMVVGAMFFLMICILLAAGSLTVFAR